MLDVELAAKSRHRKSRTSWAESRWQLGSMALAMLGIVAGSTRANAQPACQTSVPGGVVVSQIWTSAGSPYCVTGDITVSLLTVEPGVDVLVDGPYKITVLTTITVQGSTDDPVVFTARDPAVKWKGLKFQDTPPGSLLSHAIIELSDDTGLTLVNSSPLLQNCIIQDNTNPVRGGGIFADIATGTLRIERTSIINNTAGVTSGRGGGLHLKGNVEIRDSVIDGNLAKAVVSSGTAPSRGGGIYHENGTLALTRTALTGNRAEAGVSSGFAEAYGGAIYVAAGALHAVNTVVGCNSSHAGGGFGGDTRSGGIFMAGGNATVENCTIVYNVTRHGGRGGFQRSAGISTITNSIVYFNRDGNGSEAVQISGGPTVTYSDVQNGFTGVGNVAFHPSFAGPLCSDADLELLSGSPAIDAGNSDPAFDDLCFPPSKGTARNDMGADGGPAACEDGSPPSTTSTSTTVTSTTTTTSFSTPGSTATTTSSPTVTTIVATSTTTLPGKGCEVSGDAPTFDSIACRLDALLGRISGETAIGDYKDKLPQPVERAADRLTAAIEGCREGNTNRAKTQLKKTRHLIAGYLRRLRGLRARKRIPAGVRETLIAAGDDIRADATTLRRALRCPEDAASGQARRG